MGRKCNDTSGPFNFRGCDLTTEWLLAREHVRVRLPAAAPAFARSEARTMAVASKRTARRRTHQIGAGLWHGRPISNKSRTSLCSRVSKTQPAWGGTRAACHFGVVADKQCTCPASKPMWERYPPTPPFHCGKLDQCTEGSLINFFRWV